MTEIAKSDLFFFITSIAVVVISIAAVVLLVYTFFLIRKISSMVERVREEGENLMEDINHLKTRIKEKSGIIEKVPILFLLIKKLFNRKTKKNK